METLILVRFFARQGTSGEGNFNASDVILTGLIVGSLQLVIIRAVKSWLRKPWHEEALYDAILRPSVLNHW